MDYYLTPNSFIPNSSHELFSIKISTREFFQEPFSTKLTAFFYPFDRMPGSRLCQKFRRNLFMSMFLHFSTMAWPVFYSSISQSPTFTFLEAC